MCEFSSHYQKFQPIYNALRNVGVPSRLTLNFKPENVRAGHCPGDGKPLTHDEMWPQGLCSRSLCQSCYDLLRNHALKSQKCIVCGEWLPEENLINLKAMPREIAYCMHGGVEGVGECFEYFVWLHTHTVSNFDDGMLRSQDQQSAHQPNFHDSNVIDAEFEDMSAPKSLGPGQRAIPPGSTQTMNEWIQQGKTQVHDDTIYVPLPNQRLIR